jgi:hydroxyacylglutathione hydrolase
LIDFLNYLFIMKVEQIYTGCLAQGAYYIESEGEAAVIDPLREVGSYLSKAEKDGAKIKYVFETHFHADFVSGHRHRRRGIPPGQTAHPRFAYPRSYHGKHLLPAF